MNSRDLGDLTPRAAEMARNHLNACKVEGFDIFVTSTLRTLYEQAELYAQGRTRSGAIVTYADAGSSDHNHGYAWDVGFSNCSDPCAERHPWEKVGEIGKDVGAGWGGDWAGGKRDKPHFYLPSPFRPQTRRDALNGDLRRGTVAARGNIIQVQQQLTDSGFDLGEIDGDYGEKTEKAVQALQRSSRCVPSGIVGTLELNFLEGTWVLRQGQSREG